MALRFLLDTSVVKRLRALEGRTVINPLAAAGEMGRPSIRDLEVGCSARSPQEWEQVGGALDVLRTVYVTAAHLHRAVKT